MEYGKGFIIGGTGSGCGKTTISLSIMRLMRDAGIALSPFKAGPDYIDPAFHRYAGGQHSYNLDPWILPPPALAYLYGQHCPSGRIGVVEGVMGLFDGMGNEAAGSTAQLAAQLGLPVILCVSCKGSWQSVAATVRGFAGFDPKVRIAGVILNHIHGPDGYAFLSSYILQHTGIPCIGYLPSLPQAALESRHLGLVQAEELGSLEAIIGGLAAELSKSLSLSSLLELAQTPSPSAEAFQIQPFCRPLQGLVLAVARDAAFSFYYQDNLELLESQGAQLIPFSPLKDRQLPAEATAAYIGGGYPEVFASQLEANSAMRMDIARRARAGLPIYAECGGLMYLCKSIAGLDGSTHAMCGVFEHESLMHTRLQRFGYCTVRYGAASGRAHEFHRSSVNAPSNAPRLFSVEKGDTGRTWLCGFAQDRVLAGYPHLHFYTNPSLYHSIIDLWMPSTIS